jgi:WD40 repeat protein
MTGAWKQTLESHHHPVEIVALSPDGKLLAATAFRDTTVQLWEGTTGTWKHTLEGHGGSVKAIAFSPDGKLLASASYHDKTVRLWDTTTGTWMQTLEGYVMPADAILTFLPDGKLLAFPLPWPTSPSLNTNLRVRDAAQKQTPQTNVTISGTSFNDEGGQCPKTSPGLPSLNSSFALTCLHQERIVFATFIDDDHWVVRHGRKLLWLPPYYRPACGVYFNTKSLAQVALGCEFGEVVLLEFV